MIKRMIQRQYDQLLEVCKQTKAEIEHLDRNLMDSDFVQRLEIEKMQELIFSIEHDVQTKKQEIYNSEIKNRYQQLMNLYQQTNDEIRLLEATLEDNVQKIDENQNVNSKWMGNQDVHPTTSRNLFDSQAKRERLDLSMPTEPRHDGDHYEYMLKKWYTSLEKINELEEEQQQIEDPASISDVKPLTLPTPTPVPIPPQERTALVEEVIPEKEKFVVPIPTPEISPTVQAIPEIPPTVQVTPEIPPIVQVTPEVPVAPQAAPLVLIPAVPEVEGPQLEGKVIDQTQAVPAGKKKKLIRKPNKSNKMIGVSLNLMFYLILISSILFVSLSGMYNPTGRPRILGGYSIMRVATGSMSPELEVHTLIVTRRVDPATLEVGEVVTFLLADDTTITHRIYEIYENYLNLGIRGFRLIGDANHGIPDDIIHQERNLIGRVITQSYSFGRFLMFVHERFVYILIFAALILIILLVLKMVLSPKAPKEESEVHKRTEIRRAEV